MDIQYIGEQLVWGKIGNLLVMLTSVTALISAIAFYFSFKTNEDSWKRFSRSVFGLHTAGIIGIFGLLFYIILNHRFEYYYVWEHSNTKMPLRYILSCFWEGQEGSFLLWMFWHSVIGWVIIFTARQWEAGVMFFISLVQIFLGSMLLGVVVFNHKIGSNPFILLRDHPDFANLPFIKMPDYLSKIADGRGLNPLLQNYWMTIHPPTLFLGFSLTVVPFAFAMTSLMNKKLTEWVKPALIWSVIGIMVLGTGILMGAAWAYESLSFGGFWAWDPVENASLVPWMTLVGAAHVMLIYNHRQKALLSVYLLTILTFILILYSTFLTRSGILGDSSVHAFTDLGMTGQLVIYMFFFLLLAILLIAKNSSVLFKDEVLLEPFYKISDYLKHIDQTIFVQKSDGFQIIGELSFADESEIRVKENNERYITLSPGLSKYRIISMTGTEIISEAFLGFSLSINIEKLDQGSYMLETTTTDGKIFLQKISIEKTNKKSIIFTIPLTEIKESKVVDEKLLFEYQKRIGRYVIVNKYTFRIKGVLSTVDEKYIGIVNKDSHEIILRLKKAGKLKKYRIFSMANKVVMEGSLKGTTSAINIQKLEPDPYLLELTTIEGKIIYLEFTIELGEKKDKINSILFTIPIQEIKETKVIDDDHFTSREFWMFMGMLVLVLGALQITFTTSIPVLNKLFDTKLAPPVNPIDHYNKWQVPVAILLCFIMGAGQFFKYKQTDSKAFWKKLSLSIITAAVITGLCGIILKTYPPHYYLLLFASIFAAVSNFDYLFRSLKGKMVNAGPSVAHIGIAFIICGALISNSKKEIISRNMKNVDLGKDMPNKENIMIEQGNDTLPMGSYFVTYSGNEKKGVNVFYTISYFKHDEKTGELKKEFDLKPLVQLNERMGNVAEPATKHFLTRDIYTHITYAELEDKSADGNEYQKPKTHEIALGDTFMTSNSFVIFQELNKTIDRHSMGLNDSDIVVGAKLLVEDINKKLYSAEPLFMIKNFSILTQEATVDELGLRFNFNKVDPGTGKITIESSEKKSNRKDFVIMKAIIFPGINILWLGCLLMITGSLIALKKRIKKFRADQKL